LHDCYNLETCKNDSDDSLEINDSIENRISDEENDLIDTDFGAKNDQNIHDDYHKSDHHNHYHLQMFEH
jgi:hypothetical protein